MNDQQHENPIPVTEEPSDARADGILKTLNVPVVEQTSQQAVGLGTSPDGGRPSSTGSLDAPTALLGAIRIASEATQARDEQKQEKK